MTTSDRMRAWRGPALFSYGFRPFFLFGAAWLGLAMVVWIATLSGSIQLPARLDPVSWHAHEFLFGYLGAVLAGFLFTAVPNWTGRLPIVGWPLAGLFGLWGAGRVALAWGAVLPVGLAAGVDLAFPIALGAMILREIIAGRNWKNLILFALLMVFTMANGLFHLEAFQSGGAAHGMGLRLGTTTAIMMIAVIGGRIIPSFTRNWLVRMDICARPTPPMQRFDKLVLLVSLPLLLLWVVVPDAQITAIGLVVFAGLHLVRVGRWRGWHTGREALVWMLHIAYGFVPLGGLLIAGQIVLGIGTAAAAQHIWMAGAIGAMTLAVMTRASLGHTGRDLTAGRSTIMLYLSLLGSVLARYCAGIWPDLTYVAGVLWIATLAGFVWVYGPILMRPRPIPRS